MTEEIKARIKNAAALEKIIQKNGSIFSHELGSTDTYFRQPQGRVLKVTEDQRGAFVAELREKSGRFSVTKNERIEDAKKFKMKMKKEYGIESVLKKKIRVFILGKYTINIVSIKGLGSFVVLESDKADVGTLKKIMDSKNPDIISVPFNQLKKR